MDRAYNEKFEKMLGNDVTRKDSTIEFHAEKSYSRYISFISRDGSLTSLNYAYIVRCESNLERTKIVLTFTTDEITLEGQFLESLHLAILNHLPKVIECSDKRYNAINDDKIVVNEIVIRALSG